MRLASVAIVIASIGCASAPPPAARPAPTPARPQVPGAAPPSAAAALPQTNEEFDRQWNEWRRGPPGAQSPGACDRAQRCCEAYVASMNQMAGSAQALDRAQVCAGVASARSAPVGEESCRMMIDAFRTALTSAAQPVPPDCR